MVLPHIQRRVPTVTSDHRAKLLTKDEARRDRGEYRHAAKSSDKATLSGASSATPEYDFFYPLRGSSVGESPFQQSLPTLRHLEPKFPINLVLSVRGEVSTFIDLCLEKLWLVERCRNRKAPLRALNKETFVRC